jgi:hypothetical protein
MGGAIKAVELQGACTVSQELDQPTRSIVQVFIPGILLCQPYTQEYAFIESEELPSWGVLAPTWW